MAPERVPIMKPSSGVRPMVVSITRPSLTAAMEEPLPKWQVMIRVPSPSGLPKSSQQRALTYRWEVP